MAIENYSGYDSLPQRPLSKRAFLCLVGAVIFIVTGYAAALAMPDKEQQCINAGGDPWHCAEEYGRP